MDAAHALRRPAAEEKAATAAPACLALDACGRESGGPS